MVDRYRVGLLTGAAEFAGDLRAPGTLDLVFVRSPVAHARIVSMDVADASALDGVVGVYVAGDLPIVPLWEIAMIPETYAQPALADGVVRYAGERVVAVVAESLAAAIDAAERVVVEYEPLVAIVDVNEAARDVCLGWGSDAPGVVPGAASVTVEVAHRIPRLSTAPMEGHAVLAVPGPDGRLTMRVSTQVPTAARAQIARTLQLDPAQVRVVTPAVGGGFGGKAAGAVGEHMVAGAVARRLRRPVRFVEERRDNLAGMQGRGVRNTVVLHATAMGRVLGMTADIVVDAGGYPNVGAVEPGKTRMMLSGPYRLETIDVHARAVVTNLPPVGAYRGPGRSEASLMLERTLDVLAADLGIDPVEIRRRNIIPADAFPYATPTGLEYDSGDYGALLDRLVDIAGYDALRREQEARRRDGVLLGIGVALVVDSTAWFSRDEGCAVSVERDGTVLVRTGSAPSGQQHHVVYEQIVRSLLPVETGSIRVVEGDTDAWLDSAGTMGSRTGQLAGAAVLRATEDVAAQLRQAAADLLEADVDDIVLHEGRGFGVRGVPASARSVHALAGAAPRTVEASCIYQQPGATYPAAAHLSVVEIDAATGHVRPRRHIAVTDCGRVLDMPSAHAQVVGACVQGIAQALYEEAVFGADGTPLATSFAEYGIPSAADVPAIEAHFLETPSPRNPLGAKGVGEIGMIGAPVAVQNAVVDALRHLGVRHLDMPCTPHKVWQSMGSVAGADA